MAERGAPSLSTRISLNREEAAAAIGVSPVVFDKMVDAGELPAPLTSQVSRRKFWAVAALQAAMLGQKLVPMGTGPVDPAREAEAAYDGAKF